MTQVAGVAIIVIGCVLVLIAGFAALGLVTWAIETWSARRSPLSAALGLKLDKLVVIRVAGGFRAVLEVPGHMVGGPTRYTATMAGSDARSIRYDARGAIGGTVSVMLQDPYAEWMIEDIVVRSTWSYRTNVSAMEAIALLIDYGAIEQRDTPEERHPRYRFTEPALRNAVRDGFIDGPVRVRT